MKSKDRAFGKAYGYFINRGLRATSRGLAVTDSLMTELLLTNKLYDHVTVLS